MGKLTFSNVTNGINHEKVCWLPTCLHLLYPRHSAATKGCLRELVKSLSITLLLQKTTAAKNVESIGRWQQKEKWPSWALWSGSDQNKGRSEGEENGVSILSGCLELGVNFHKSYANALCFQVASCLWKVHQSRFSHSGTHISIKGWPCL